VWSVVLGLLTFLLVERYGVAASDRVLGRGVLDVLVSVVVVSGVGAALSVYGRERVWPWLRTRFPRTS
jgi:hypothetical protein